MFQSYQDISDPSLAAHRVEMLRQRLKELQLDGFLVPRADEHLGEYVPAYAERLQWLTGFSGSAGLAVILPDKAAIFVDGRYTLQAAAQVDGKLFEICQLPQPRLADWLQRHARRGAVIGYDPWLHRMAQIKAEKEKLASQEISLTPLAQNPIDEIWQDQPAPPRGPVQAHPLKYAGRSAADKLADCQAELKAAGHQAVILAAADSVSWLFNIRGHDIPHTPVVRAFAIVHSQKKPELFIASQQLSKALREKLKTVAILRAPEKLPDRVKALAEKAAPVRLDPMLTPQYFAETLKQAGAAIVQASDPCLLPKAIKNSAEIRGARNAHLRDGVALTRFLHWLDCQTEGVENGALTGVDEIAAAQKLEQCRIETGKLKDISFDTISGAGPNGAIVHYRVSESSNAPLVGGSLYLVDSGGQYLDGTTDVTRTVPIGPVSHEMRRHFTLVLKGHIALATARFPEGTRGCDLDPLARAPLWAAGLDFDHGTGHGVGAYLSVHEGPQNISKRGTVPLKPGMILSNEPGYYKPGAYGIRIENLLLVTKPAPIAGGERKMLGFETLTLAPIDRRLIDVALLSEEERVWLNDYHQRVASTLAPHLAPKETDWLQEMTAPL